MVESNSRRRASSSGATRGRRCSCSEVPGWRRPNPAVLPAVSYRNVRPWKRGGAKLPVQRSLLLREGSQGASRGCDCQHQGGREPGSGGQVNPGKASLNVVTQNKRKMLIRLDQKVCGQVWWLRTPPAQMPRHRRRDATFPTLVHRRNVVSPLSSRSRTPRGWGRRTAR